MKNKLLKKETHLPELTAALLVLLIRFFYYKNSEFAELRPDSASYMKGWGGFRAGNRMPLYPAIIHLNKFIFGDFYLTGVVVCQILVSLIAVVFFYKAVNLATQNRLIACIATTFYGCYPEAMGFDTVILSESFAISLSIFLLYFTVRYIRDSTEKNGWYMMMFVFMSVCEKPALVIYVAAVFALLILQFFLQREKRKIVCRLIGIDLFIAGLLLLYASQVYVNAGTFNIDKRGPKHVLASCLQSGVYKNYFDSELVMKIEEIYTRNSMEVGGAVLEEIAEMFGNNPKEYNPQLAKFNSYCIESDTKQYVRYMLGRFTRNINLNLKMDVSITAEGNTIDLFILQLQKLLIFVLCVGHVYLIDLAAAILLIVKWFKSKECPWYYLGTTGILSAIIISVFCGTYGDYNRCIVYVLPFACFGIALLCKDLFSMAKKYQRGPL